MMEANTYLTTPEFMLVPQPFMVPVFLPPTAADRDRLKQQIEQVLPFLDREHIVELFSPYSELIQARIEIYLDYENLHISLRRMGWTPEPEILVEAIRSAVRDLGIVTAIKAYADWAFLERSSGYDISRTLKMNRVEPLYTLKGKNSADIAMINGLRDALEVAHNKVDIIVIGTGDGDFYPVIETIKRKGKQAIVLACKNSLSQSLQQEANEVIYLNNYLDFAELRRRPSCKATPVRA
jgi:uncharacterized LabA/DUF88 family protein